MLRQLLAVVKQEEEERLVLFPEWPEKFMILKEA